MQDTTFDAARAQVDPDNRLLWRRRPRRLEAEILRDAVLAVSGTLNHEPFGPAFKPPIPPEAMVARNTKSPYPQDARDTPATRRRTVYMFHKRVVQHPLMQAFDGPDAAVSCGRRNNTTVAPQALALLNDPFVRDRAADFARRLLAEGDATPERWVDARLSAGPVAAAERRRTRGVAAVPRRAARAPCGATKSASPDEAPPAGAGRLLPGAVQTERVHLCGLSLSSTLRPLRTPDRPAGEFLARAGGGLGLLALADLLHVAGAGGRRAAPRPTRSRRGRRISPPKAKAVIWLFMEGGPSGVDLFDPKPELDKSDGKQIEIDVFNGNPGPLMKSPFKFKQYGECGAWVCEKYPNVARHVDDIAFVKSLLHRVERPRAGAVSDEHRHRPGRACRRPGPGSPTAWAARTRTCPASSCWATTQGVKGGPLNWSAGFLPTTLPGDAVPLAGQPDPQPAAAQGRRRRRPAGAARPAGQAERRAPATRTPASPT